MSATLSLDGLTPLRAWLRRARARLSRRTALHDRAGRAIGGWVDANFEAEGRLGVPGGGNGAGWPPLAARTLAQRRRAGLGSKPLQATGRLRAGVRLRSGASGATVDNPVPYAAVHQLGLGVPARPFFPTPLQARRIVFPEAESFVREALR